MSGTAFMRFVFATGVALLLGGCSQRSGILQQKVVGTWGSIDPNGVITFGADGSVRSRFTVQSHVWTFEGTWRLNGDEIVVTTTKSNSVPYQNVARYQIIRADDNELVYESKGQRLSWHRR